MNRLIKRYILKTQRDKDNDEVNEGEFDHLKKKKKVQKQWCHNSVCATDQTQVN